MSSMAAVAAEPQAPSLPLQGSGVILMASDTMLKDREMVVSPLTIELSKYQLLKERFLAEYPHEDEEDLAGGNH